MRAGRRGNPFGGPVVHQDAPQHALPPGHEALLAVLVVVPEPGSVVPGLGDQEEEGQEIPDRAPHIRLNPLHCALHFGGGLQLTSQRGKFR